MLVNVKDIRRDGGTQMRPELNAFRVEEIAEALRETKPVDPVEVVYDGTSYWLVNGFHRVAGYEKAGKKACACLVTPGTQRDAVRLSLGANADQDKQPRSRETIQNAIRTALLDPEWGDDTQVSSREIARWIKVSEGTIRNWRERLAPQPEPEPDHPLEAPAPNPKLRVGRDGRSINTANIGSAQKKAAQARQAAAPVVAPSHALPVTLPFVPPPLPPSPPQELVIQAGNAWDFDDHRVYCGEASDYQFQDNLLPSGLAFVTLTPGTYDVNYDWLSKYARTIAVLIQESSTVQPFLQDTKLHYGYAMGCTLYNEWGYLAFFAQSPLWNADELDDTDTQSSPNKLFTALLTTYTTSGEAVIVVDGPQQGAFSPLIRCQELKRRCLLASTYKADLQSQVKNYRNFSNSFASAERGTLTST